MVKLWFKGQNYHNLIFFIITNFKTDKYLNNFQEHLFGILRLRKYQTSIKHNLVEFKVHCLKVFCYHGNKSTILVFYWIFIQLLKFLVNFTLLKYVKSQRSYGFLITKELIFGFQILDLKDHFSASLKSSLLPVFFNLNVAKFKNLRLLLNRCQSLCQKEFVCVLIKLSYETCSSMLHLKMVH